MYSAEQEYSAWQYDSNHESLTGCEDEMPQELQELRSLNEFDSPIPEDTTNRPAEPSGPSSDGCFFTGVGGDLLADRKLFESFPNPSETIDYLTPVSGQHSNVGFYSGNVEPYSSQPATTPLPTIDDADASWSNNSLGVLTSASSTGDWDPRHEYPLSQTTLSGIQCSGVDDNIQLLGSEGRPPDTAAHATGHNNGGMTEYSVVGVLTCPSRSPGMGSTYYDHTRSTNQLNRMELGRNDPNFSDSPWDHLSLLVTQESGYIQPHLTYSAAASYDPPNTMDDWNGDSAVSGLLQPSTSPTFFEPNSHRFSESMPTVRASLTSDNLINVSQRTHGSSSNYSPVESYPRNARATLKPQRTHRHSKTRNGSRSVDTLLLRRKAC
jgi:hypothetical protein